MSNMQDVLLNDFSDEAERSFVLGDTFDMKANVLLVVITFLAAQTAYFLGIVKMPVEHYGQVASAILLAIAAVLVLLELRPKDYIFFSPSNGAIERKISKLQKEYGKEQDHKILEHLVRDEIEWARERAKKHKELNRQKSTLLQWAFYITAWSVAINLVTLLAFAILPS